MLAATRPFTRTTPSRSTSRSCAQPPVPAALRPQPPRGINIADGSRTPGTARNGLIARLLIDKREQRIGCLQNGAEDSKKHKWFRGLNWAALYNKQMEPPMVPDLRSDDDTRYYATYPDSVEESGPLLTPQKQKMFDFWC